MKRTIFLTLILAGCISICLAAFECVGGTWKSVFNAPDGNQYPLTYNFKIDGNKLTGTLDAVGETTPIDSGKVYGDSLSFSVTVQGVEYDHKGIYHTAGDSISMDVGYSGTVNHMTMTRAK